MDQGNIDCTGKSLSEAIIFASINPQYDNRLFMELPWKLQAQNMGKDLPVIWNCEKTTLPVRFFIKKYQSVNFFNKQMPQD